MVNVVSSAGRIRATAVYVSLVGGIVSAAGLRPTPTSDAVSVPPVVAVTVSEAFCVPALVGVNFTVTVHMPPASRVDPAQPVALNCASLVLTVSAVVGEAPVFCTVKLATVVLCVPTSEEPQLPLACMILTAPAVSAFAVTVPPTLPPCVAARREGCRLHARRRRRDRRGDMAAAARRERGPQSVSMVNSDRFAPPGVSVATLVGMPPLLTTRKLAVVLVLPTMMSPNDCVVLSMVSMAGGTTTMSPGGWAMSVPVPADRPARRLNRRRPRPRVDRGRPRERRADGPRCRHHWR